MRKGSKILVAGVAALACAGAVFAAGQDVHVLKVQLPDGSIEQIRYTGDVAPRVTVAPARPVAEESDPFADMDRMFAAMEAQSDAMLRQAAALASQAPAAPVVRTSTGDQPQGTGSYHYSYVSSTGGANGGCTQSYEMTSFDGAQAPKVVSHQSGDCKGVPALTPTAVPAKPDAKPTAMTPPTPPQPRLPVAPAGMTAI